jgi:hypothetical protein
VNETRLSLLITSRFTQTRHTCVNHSQISESSHTSTTLFENGSEFAGKLSEFRPSTSLKESEDADARGRIAVLEEKGQINTTAPFVVLEDKLKQLSTDFQRLAGEVSTLRSVAAGNADTLRRGFRSEKKGIAAGLRERTAEQFSTRFDELRKRSFGSEATNCWASWRFGFALKSGGSVNFIGFDAIYGVN